MKTEMEVPTSIAVLVILARWEKSLAQSDGANDKETSAMARSFGRRREHLAEYCIENTRVCHIPFVWRFLVHQHLKNGDVRRCQGLLYRAFKDCPLSKVKENVSNFVIMHHLIFNVPRNCIWIW